MSKFEEPDILFNMLNCLKILCLHGECLYLARKDYPQFLAYIQEKMLIPRCVLTVHVSINCCRIVELGSDLVFVFQSVVHVKIRVLSAGVLGCASAPPRPLSVPWGWHLLEPHQLKLQQQRLENTIWSRWETMGWLLIKIHLINAIASKADYIVYADINTSLSSS